MIIAYTVKHRYSNPIELCGEFNSLEHFRKFQMVEEYRGWFVVGEIKIIRN